MAAHVHDRRHGSKLPLMVHSFTTAPSDSATAGSQYASSSARAPQAKPAAVPVRCTVQIEAVVQEEADSVITVATWEYDRPHGPHHAMPSEFLCFDSQEAC